MTIIHYFVIIGQILPCFSNFFQNVVYNRLIDFIEKQIILFSHKYGFRSQHFTSLALIQLIDEILSNEKKEYCTGIFLHLSKAFDTVNHVT